MVNPNVFKKKKLYGVEYPPINMRKLEAVCAAPIDAFDVVGKRVDTQHGPYFFREGEQGSNVLAVAHLDTVLPFNLFEVVERKSGTRVYCPTLDNRIGAYLMLSYLKELGLNDYDLLLTDAEEQGRSTAQFFNMPQKQWNWMFQFDRSGAYDNKDVVLYRYKDSETVRKLASCGITVGRGLFSDISKMEHLGIKGFNFFNGTMQNHSPRDYVMLPELQDNLQKFLKFYNKYRTTMMPHTPQLLYRSSNYQRAQKAKMIPIKHYKKPYKKLAGGPSKLNQPRKLRKYLYGIDSIPRAKRTPLPKLWAPEEQKKQAEKHIDNMILEHEMKKVIKNTVKEMTHYYGEEIRDNGYSTLVEECCSQCHERFFTDPSDPDEYCFECSEQESLKMNFKGEPLPKHHAMYESFDDLFDLPEYNLGKKITGGVDFLDKLSGKLYYVRKYGTKNKFGWKRVGLRLSQSEIGFVPRRTKQLSNRVVH